MTHRPERPDPDDRTGLERVASRHRLPAGVSLDDLSEDLAALIFGIVDQHIAAAIAPLHARIEDLAGRVSTLEAKDST